MIIGYARVSSVEQNLELQRDALNAAGCEEIFEDKASGAKIERPEWGNAKKQLRQGDTLVVWRLDRLGRSLKHLIQTIEELDTQGIGFRSLQENLDTTTSGGKLIFHIFGALAEFERELIKERTMAGLAAARARGRKGGRPRKLTTSQIAMAKQLLLDPNQQVTEVAKMLGVARSTLYMALRSETPAKGGQIMRWYRQRFDGETGERYYEHHAIAEWKIGRQLRPGEVVHHLNNDPRDNHPDNLVVLPTQSAHIRLHHYQRREAAGVRHLFPLRCSSMMRCYQFQGVRRPHWHRP